MFSSNKSTKPLAIGIFNVFVLKSILLNLLFLVDFVLTTIGLETTGFSITTSFVLLDTLTSGLTSVCFSTTG